MEAQLYPIAPVDDFSDVTSDSPRGANIASLLGMLNLQRFPELCGDVNALHQELEQHFKEQQQLQLQSEEDTPSSSQGPSAKRRRVCPARAASAVRQAMMQRRLVELSRGEAQVVMAPIMVPRKADEALPGEAQVASAMMRKLEELRCDSGAVTGTGTGTATGGKMPRSLEDIRPALGELEITMGHPVGPAMKRKLEEIVSMVIKSSGASKVGETIDAALMRFALPGNQKRSDASSSNHSSRTSLSSKESTRQLATTQSSPHRKPYSCPLDQEPQRASRRGKAPRKVSDTQGKGARQGTNVNSKPEFQSLPSKTAYLDSRSDKIVPKKKKRIKQLDDDGAETGGRARGLMCHMRPARDRIRQGSENQRSRGSPNAPEGTAAGTTPASTREGDRNSLAVEGMGMSTGGATRPRHRALSQDGASSGGDSDYYRASHRKKRNRRHHSETPDVDLLSCRDEDATCPSRIISKTPPTGNGSRTTKGTGDRRSALTSKERKAGRNSKKQRHRRSSHHATQAQDSSSTAPAAIAATPGPPQALDWEMPADEMVPAVDDSSRLRAKERRATRDVLWSTKAAPVSRKLSARKISEKKWPDHDDAGSTSGPSGPSCPVPVPVPGSGSGAGPGPSRASTRGPRTPPPLVVTSLTPPTTPTPPPTKRRFHPNVQPPPLPPRPPTPSASWASSCFSMNKDGLPPFHCCNTDDVFFDTKNRFFGRKSSRNSRQSRLPPKWIQGSIKPPANKRSSNTALFPPTELRQRSEENLDAVTGPAEVESWLGVSVVERDQDSDSDCESSYELRAALAGLKKSSGGHHSLQRKQSQASVSSNHGRGNRRMISDVEASSDTSDASDYLPAASTKSLSHSAVAPPVHRVVPRRSLTSITLQTSRSPEKHTRSCQNLEVVSESPAEIAIYACKEEPQCRVVSRRASRVSTQEVPRVIPRSRTPDESPPEPRPVHRPETRAMPRNEPRVVSRADSPIAPRSVSRATSPDMSPDTSHTQSRERSRSASRTATVSRAVSPVESFELSAAGSPCTSQTESQPGSLTTSQAGSLGSRQGSLASRESSRASRVLSRASRAASRTASRESRARKLPSAHEKSLSSSRVESCDGSRVVSAAPSRNTADVEETNSWWEESSSWMSTSSRNHNSSSRRRKDVRVTVAWARRTFSRLGGNEPRDSLGALIGNLLARYIGAFMSGTRGMRRRSSGCEVSLAESCMSQLRAAAMEAAEVAASQRRSGRVSGRRSGRLSGRRSGRTSGRLSGRRSGRRSGRLSGKRSALKERAELMSPAALVGSCPPTLRPASDHEPPRRSKEPRAAARRPDVPRHAARAKRQERSEAVACAEVRGRRRGGCGDAGGDHSASAAAHRESERAVAAPHDAGGGDDDDDDGDDEEEDDDEEEEEEDDEDERNDTEDDDDDDDDESASDDDDDDDENVADFGASFLPDCERQLLESYLSGDYDFSSLLEPVPELRALFEAVGGRTRVAANAAASTSEDESASGSSGPERAAAPPSRRRAQRQKSRKPSRTRAPLRTANKT